MMKRRAITTLVGISAAVVLGSAVLDEQTKSLRVCADADYLPYSNRAGEGFENKIAAAIAKHLAQNLEYVWGSYRGKGGFPEFLSRTLEAHKCDVVMSIPFGSKEELTTRPYYISSYVFVFKNNKDYNIASMNSPVLKGLKIGFEEDTPVEDALKMRGLLANAVPFEVGKEDGKSPSTMIDAIGSGGIDVLITWQPAIGAFLNKHPELEVIPVPNERSLGPPEQYLFPMSMGVREGDEQLQKALDDVIAKHQDELTSILTQSGVKLYTPADPNTP
jgi:mxaJ protein